MTATFEDTSSSIGLQTQADYKPVTQTELEQAYAQYSGQGLKFGQAKGQSDQALYAKATDVVMRWWKATKAQKNASLNVASGVPPSGGSAAGQVVSGGGSTSAGSPYSSGGGVSASGGGMLLPNTAINPGAPNNAPVLPPILTSAEKQQQTLQRQAGEQKAAQAEPQILTPAQARVILTSMGAPSTWHPPASALASAATLHAWVQRAAANQHLLLARAQQPILDNATTASIIRGMNSSISISSVPRYARYSVVALRNYIVQTNRATAMLKQASNSLVSSSAALQRRTGGF